MVIISLYLSLATPSYTSCACNEIPHAPLPSDLSRLPQISSQPRPKQDTNLLGLKFEEAVAVQAKP